MTEHDWSYQLKKRRADQKKKDSIYNCFHKLYKNYATPKQFKGQAKGYLKMYTEEWLQRYIVKIYNKFMNYSNEREQRLKERENQHVDGEIKALFREAATQQHSKTYSPNQIHNTKIIYIAKK